MGEYIFRGKFSSSVDLCESIICEKRHTSEHYEYAFNSVHFWVSM